MNFLRLIFSRLRSFEPRTNLSRGSLRSIARDVYYRLPLPTRFRAPLRRFAMRMLGFELLGKEPSHSVAVREVAFQAPIINADDAAIFLSDSANTIRIDSELNSTPEVSVIIPVYNQASYTLHCLKSIAAVGAHVSFEVIIVDDGSSDETQDLLARCSGVRALRNANNLGFIGACNAGGGIANGRYLHFLNNDTVVTPGWLDTLYETFLRNPTAGLVGSKLVYPNWKLQEAGGIIWRDGSAWNYGRMDDAGKPEYCYLRDVDYVSGASIMVPRNLFIQQEGFDSYYAPAYGEDSDLAFKLRRAGYRVLYQPFSVVVHYEGATSGVDINSGVKQYQRSNQKKLAARWHDALKKHGIYGRELWLERERAVQRRILIVDAVTPRIDQDAGSWTVMQHIEAFQSLGYKVTFIPHDLAFDGKYTERLQSMGVECVYAPFVTSIKNYIKTYGRHFQLALLYRPYIASRYLGVLRRNASMARVIYFTVDLHYLRERRQAELENNVFLARRASSTERQELELISESDAAIVVSPMEKEILKADAPDANVHVVKPAVVEQPEGAPFEERKNVLFIGGYLHTPNVDAVRYFVGDVLPKLREKLPDVRFIALGSNPPAEIRALACEYVDVPGLQSDISGYFNSGRVMVAPLRYGAGIKGKILTSLSYGVPVVASSIAVEGMAMMPEKEILIADAPEEIVTAILRLYNDKDLWTQLSKAGRRLINECYSLDAVDASLRAVLESINADVERERV